MRASASGPVGALLMIAPLVAIPILATVGIPQFAPVIASSVGEEQFDGEGVADLDSAAFPSAAETTPLPRRTADDLFAPYPDRSPAARAVIPVSSRNLHSAALTEWDVRQTEVALTAAPQSRQTKPSTDWTPPPEALDGWEIAGVLKQVETTNSRDSNPPVQALLLEQVHPIPTGIAQPENSAAALAPESENEPVSVPEQFPAEPFTWQTATERLKTLGIRKYRLETQAEADRFLFTASLTSPDQPRIMRKFEAEAEAPLLAVQKVLEQIDAWHAQR